ncbi:molybdopterin molybdotransferase MoeA [Novosphingobium piscinae]|uniref:Molybdopterin molybdenumtransferase n=1 Tax=Novosphingobium piscinae TaxID=1507448 RepID=A0A7X1KP46_9SPHN|nr:molybdopterin molybdotransferase MoeA [Novosphingobium piscinae]MBC2668369.1 molybdopterin molybdotransferase MoeA [Novosphingobium piscinae]
MTGFTEALARLAETARPLGAETVPLDAAHGRVLAAPVIARLAAPRHAVSAMDGYAVVDAATAPGVPLPVVGEARPGQPHPGPLAPGQAVRIFTGGPLPVGADRVIVQEQAQRSGDTVRFLPGYGPGWHVRTAGSDFAAGTTLLPAGTRLTARALVTAAGADLAAVAVHRRPRVAVLGTGDELAAPGTAAAQDWAIPESVTLGVAALAAEAGATITWRGSHGDDLPGLTRLAGALLPGLDLLVVTGGASVGAYDFAKAMLEPHGLELVFSRLAIKPGKPVWFGRVGDRLVLGLPGNPTSALVTATLFLRPLLAALQGESPEAALPWRRLPLAAPLAGADERETFTRAVWAAEGLVPIGNQDSGAQAALGQAGWLIRCPAGTPARGAGEWVTALAL